jgi:Radical SAM superfamily/B12 binding domain
MSPLPGYKYSMTYGLILADGWGQFDRHRLGIRRANKAHELAQFLREHEYQVDVVDFMYEFTHQDIVDILHNIAIKKPRFIGVSVTLGKEYQYWDQVIHSIRNIFPDIIVIVSGERVLRLNYFGADFYVEGYAETAFLNIVQNANIKYVEIGNRKLVQEKDYANNLAEKSFCPWHVESDFVTADEALFVSFSRGCVFNCAFCNHSLVGVPKLKFERNQTAIKNSIMHMYTKFGVTKFMISDSTFNDYEWKTDLLLEIARDIPVQLEIVCFLRIDLLYKQQGLLEKLVSAGVKAVHFGIDSLHPESSKIIGKKIDPATVKQYLIDIRRQYPNLFMYGTFIAGLPKDTVENQFETAQWLKDTRVLDRWWWFPLSIKSDSDAAAGESLSPIDKDPAKYGYTAKSDQLVFTNGRGGRDRNFIPVNWSNDYASFESSMEICQRINSDSAAYIKFNPWMMFSAAVVYKNIDWWIKFESVGDYMTPVINNTEKFIQDYKIKKLQYFDSFAVDQGAGH